MSPSERARAAWGAGISFAGPHLFSSLKCLSDREAACRPWPKRQPARWANPRPAAARMWLKITIFFVLTASFGSHLIFGESPDAVLQKSNFSDHQKKAVLAVFIKADQVQIPGEFLLPRLEEGIAKRAGGDLVVDALARELQSLQAARSVLLKVLDNTEVLKDRTSWMRTANLLTAGIETAEVERIARACRDRWNDYREATLLFVSLLKWGLQKKSTLSVIEAVMRSGISREEIAGIMALFIIRQKIARSPGRTGKAYHRKCRPCRQPELARGENFL